MSCLEQYLCIVHLLIFFMAQTPVSVAIGTTGATGGTGFTNLKAAHNTAVAAAVTAALAVTGAYGSSVTVSPAAFTADTGSGYSLFVSTVYYLVIT